MIEEPPRPLRILAIVNLPWDPRLGAARVWIELAEEWKKAGHRFEKFCLTDAFPRPSPSRGLSALRQAIFPYRAASYVRRHAERFDIIDSLIGTLPFSKESLGFRGLLVARSVGLHRLYKRFHRFSRERWPDQPQGRLLGKLFYQRREQQLEKNADEAIRCCDLLNLPNESEREELQNNMRLARPILVQPYGLSEAHRRSLQEAARSVRERLQNRKICFIGMWGLRKGARDWRKIIPSIAQQLPEARFLFLGTMFETETVLRELGPTLAARVQCIRTFDPAELPALLSDCTLGLFPSYVEGFGLAVLEQLAAGLPTIAYDVPGPRQILGAQSDLLLSQVGDPSAMVERAMKILKMTESEYTTLAIRCHSLAAEFRWDRIAGETIERYRVEFERLRRLILFIQPFPVAGPGGGPRIIRSLLQDAPVATRVVCTSPAAPPSRYLDAELHLPLRPNLGRIERTRFNALAHALTPFFRRRFARRLEQVCALAQPDALHSVAHGGLDFYDAYCLARKLRIPFFLHIHDDVVYTAAGRVPAQVLSRCLAETWRGAQARFVISQELGDEYARRYGERDFVIVTDGVEKMAIAPRPPPAQLRIYFMGLFHVGYEKNLESLLQALALLPRDAPALRDCSITLRCDYVRPSLLRGAPVPVRILPFGSEADVAADLVNADLLYLPLHFGEADRPFAVYSLSTKMVTYLGSGIPILYHGPENTAAYKLLQKHRAAALATSLSPSEVAHRLTELIQGDAGTELAKNGLQLVRQNFLRTEQHNRFWHTVLALLPSPNESVTQTPVASALM